jgi:hypothetical protein
MGVIMPEAPQYQAGSFGVRLIIPPPVAPCDRRRPLSPSAF